MILIASRLWLAVCHGLYKEDYLKNLNVCYFHNTIFTGWVPVNWFNHTCRVVVVTPTDCPKSVRIGCVIEDLTAFLCCHIAFGAFCGSKGFCHRTDSDRFLFILIPHK